MTATATLATWLDRQLARREWSRADFARHLGVGTGTVSKWFNGRMPSPEYCDRIADTLGADRDVVLALAGHRSLDEEADPESPERVLLPMIRKIKWTPDRLRIAQRDLQWFIDEDEEKQR